MSKISGMLLMAGLFLLGCSSGSSTSANGTPAGAGHCDDKCLKACGSDSDCDPSKSELCCDFGANGKACTDASVCPRFCASDSKCDAANGEACLRTTLASSQSVCADPSKDNALKLCSTDKDCTADTLCCTIYKESVCLKADKCPKGCSASADCNTKIGEVCCTTLKLQDPTLAAAGLCVDPAQVECPKACAMSSDCDTKSGELCCDGLCSKDCVKSCKTSSDCSGQICCTAAAENSPWVQKTKDPGYPVAMGTTGGGGTGAGGSTGSAGTSAGGTGASGGTSGGGGTGGSGPACETCSQAVVANDFLGTNVCSGNSATLLQSLQACVCETGCATECASVCTTGSAPDDTCKNCIATSCLSEYVACNGD